MAIVGLGDALVFLHTDPSDAPGWLSDALDRKVRGVGVLQHIEVPSVAEVKKRLEERS